MDNTPDLPRIIEGTLHRVLEDSDLRTIFRYRHNWHRFYTFLFLTGIRPVDIAMLISRSLARERNVIGYYRQSTGKYVEVSVPPNLLDVFPMEMPQDQPLFPELHSAIEDDDHRADQLNEKLGQPAEFLEALLAAAGRPAASLIAFRMTFDHGIKEGNEAFPRALIARLTDPLEIMDMPQS